MRLAIPHVSHRRRSHREGEYLSRMVDLRLVFGKGKLICPWHKDQIPSLMVYPDHLYCYACRERHDGIEVLMAQRGLSYAQAAAYLRKFVGRGQQSVPALDPTPVPWEEVRAWHQKLLDDAYAQRWLQKRGLGLHTMTALQLGWSENRRYAIPHIVNGEVVNVKFRVHPEYQMDGEPKYSSLPGKAFPKPYPYDLVMNNYAEAEALFLTEGEFDAMILLQEGMPALSLPSGATHQILQWRGDFQQFGRVVLLFDQDQAGQKAVQEILRVPHTGDRTLDRSVAERLGVPVEAVSWPSDWGKDVTEARTWLLPWLKEGAYAAQVF